MTRILTLGWNPYAFSQADGDPHAPVFAAAHARAAALDVDLVECLFAPADPPALLALIGAALDAGPFDAIVIGGGLRKPPDLLALFEAVVNLVHRRAPAAAIAFNTSPADTVDSALRALGQNPTR
ncbi:MAG TPA: hypothetical protein VGM88_13970 [Kofleriaceae bacterium]|jgi:hypothetical protein